MKRFHYPHRFSPRSEDNARIQDMAQSLVLGRLAIMNDRLAQGGPCTLGTRFSLADAYLAYWVAWLGRDEVCGSFPSIARLYHLVRARPRIGACLEETERMAETYASMMTNSPGGVIA